MAGLHPNNLQIRTLQSQLLCRPIGDKKYEEFVSAPQIDSCRTHSNETHQSSVCARLLASIAVFYEIAFVRFFVCSFCLCTVQLACLDHFHRSSVPFATFQHD